MKKILLILSCFGMAACPLKKADQLKSQQPDPCEYLIDAQKEFAKLLSATHQQIFCSQFTNEQRMKAISLSDTGITPDEAVEQVLTESRGTPPAPPAKKKSKPLTIIK